MTMVHDIFYRFNLALTPFHNTIIFFKGKGLSIWDTFTANVSAVTQGANGKVACDSYHLYQKDVDLFKSLNVSCPLHFLKFSFTP